MLPEKLKNCRMYGVEIDSISGRIAGQLYQKATIAIQAFEKTNMPDNFFDVVIGNVPFDDKIKPNDSRYNKYKFVLHDYFFAKALDKVRPGGVVVFISSKGTMDKENSNVRRYLAQRAELIGAIRLPDNTFKNNAGTEVTSDIIFLKKRDKITDIDENWIKTDISEDGIKMNKYFIDNPNMIMGKMTRESSQFGGERAVCKMIDGSDLDYMLSNAISNLESEIEEYDFDELIESEEKFIQAEPNVKNYSYAVIDGKVYYRENSIMREKDLPETTINRIKGMVKLRDCTKKIIELQVKNSDDIEIKQEQNKLNSLYDDFVKRYGRINSRGNNQAFSDDSSYYLLCSLEITDSKGNFKRKADMFYKKTIKAKKVVTKVDTANEALIVSLSEKARVDIEYMETLTDKTEDELINELEGQIFMIPNVSNEEKRYVMADEYLSGNVREKLKVAKEFAKENPKFEINVKELEKVIPEDIKASEISVRLGATWVPIKYIEQFMYELLDTKNEDKEKIKVYYSECTGGWNITGKSEDKGVKATTTYGVKKASAYKIIETTLNLNDIRIYKKINERTAKEKIVLDKQQTAIAQAKQDEIRMKFEEWIFKDKERRDELVKIYNERFNSIRNRQYDGSHLKFYGMNPEIKLRKHQIDAIARILYNGNTLLAHEVRSRKNI